LYSLKSTCSIKYIFHRRATTGSRRIARRESDATAAAGGLRDSAINNLITAISMTLRWCNHPEFFLSSSFSLSFSHSLLSALSWKQLNFRYFSLTTDNTIAAS